MQPAVPPPSGPPRGLRPGDLLVLAGALIVFGFSFAPFVQYSDRTREGLFLAANLISPRFSAWSLETFMVPLTSFVVLAALLGAAAVGIRFWLGRDPDLLGFRLRQLEVGTALFGFLVLLGMVASDKHVFVGARRFAEVDRTLNLEEVALDTSWGAVLMLVGATLALVGTLLNHYSVGPVFAVGANPSGDRGSGPETPPPPPGSWQEAPPPPWREAPPAGTWQDPRGGNPPPPGGPAPPPGQSPPA
jgi:hypothetical protein